MISEKKTLDIVSRFFLEARAVEPPIADTFCQRVPSISGRQTTIPMHVDANACPKGVHLLEDGT